eukprot:CAMPEP_0179124062 /NCGR_PEP_ID=MMETSP0796-20121207/58611_1 /TAXON_ID=73915 /ORGANISM="Pyrodinium bahamense, Strain pbaha01" /LENGTH=118 /DNA_ID=CAMNT_0020822711 /DNA_START=1 /DNA_END=357 /DNA_ORIENTATION=-
MIEVHVWKTNQWCSSCADTRPFVFTCRPGPRPGYMQTCAPLNPTVNPGHSLNAARNGTVVACGHATRVGPPPRGADGAQASHGLRVHTGLRSYMQPPPEHGLSHRVKPFSEHFWTASA